MLICHVNAASLKGLDQEVACFKALGAELRAVRCSTPDELEANVKDAEILLFTATKFDDEVFDRLPNLRLLVRYGIGYDTVDIGAAKRHNVIVCNSPTYGCYDVAEHAFALLQAANRKIAVYDRKMRGGNCGASAAYPCYRMAGKQMGFIGYGRIARNMANFALGFGMKLAAYDPYADAANANPPAAAMSLEELLKTSDFVSINSVLNDQTRGMMNAERFALMKPTAILVNTSRGGLIDEDALYEALVNKTIRAAGIDVWNEMPKTADNRFCQLDNIVMTPHAAWNTVEAAQALKEEVMQTVTRYIKGEELPNRLWR